MLLLAATADTAGLDLILGASSALGIQSTFQQRQRGHLAMAALLDNDANADRRAWHLARRPPDPTTSWPDCSKR